MKLRLEVLIGGSALQFHWAILRALETTLRTKFEEQTN
jgi:hypothetical protein